MFSATIGSQGSGAGQLSSPEDVAVNDATGDIYVADAGNDRIDEFSASGTFIEAWGWGVADGASSFESCTTACQVGVSGSGAGQFESPSFVAVDNSSGPSSGDVYVGDIGDNLVTKFTAAGSIVSSWGTDGQLNGSAATGGPFSSMAGIAVGTSGNLNVYDPNREDWFVFGQDGTAQPTISVGRGTDNTGIGVDSSGNLYKVVGAGNLEQYSSAGSDIGDVSDDQTGGGITGFAIDPTTNDIYADDGGSLIRHYGGASLATCVASGSCAAADTFGSGDLNGAAGLAVDSSNATVYAADTGDQRIDEFALVTLPDVTTGQATSIQTTAATLNGTVNPDATTITDCHFDYVDAADYNPSATNPYSAGATAACASTPSGSTPVAVSAAVTGLTPGTLYHFRLDAGTSNGTTFGSDQTFGAGASVDSETVSDVGSTDATLNALINPNGVPTSYHFEYGTSAGDYPNSTPEESAGSAKSDAGALALVSGLEPSTTYHYRVVATNSIGTTDGPDQTFATYGAPPVFASCRNDQFRYGYGADLPDCRAYEQVTPVDKDGTNPTGAINLVQASSSGDAVTFFSLAGVPGGTGAENFPLFLSSRGSDGWSTQGLLPPPSYGETAAVLGWTPDLSEAFDDATSSNGSTTFLLRNTADGSLQTIGTSQTEEWFAAGASADGSEILFEEGGPQLTADAAPGQDNLYVWDKDTGKLALAGVLPDGTTPSGGSFAGPYDWPFDGTTSGGAESFYTQNTISADGSKVFFTASGTGQLYMRENPLSPGAATAQLSASQKTNGTGPGGTDPNGPQPAAFMAATPDGSHVFFTSREELTNDATTGSADQGNDLYAYDTATGSLTDLTPDTTDANGAEVQGVLGTSDDGSYVYFVANGVLAPGASPGTCNGSPTTRIATSGTCSLYLWHNGAISFIAQLSPAGDQQPESQVAGYSDVLDWVPGPHGTIATEKTSRVTPDGQAVLFSSHQRLTAYDNDGYTEFYRYSASSGQLTCVSCDPTGAAPTGNATLQSITPGVRVTTANILTRNLSNSGDQVFFESPDPLVLAATNNTQNVYEWEADGAGSCQSTSEDGGCVYLISSGKSPDPSYFADASASGDDVFFFTSQALVGQDQDQLVDIYDARVDGGLASQNPASQTPCSGESCKPPPSVAPPPPTAATATFSGPDNLSPIAAAPKVSVLSKVVHGTSFVVRVRIPTKGRITITGAGVKTVRRSVTGGGTYRVKVTLTAQMTKALARRHKLKLKLRVGYTPAGGTAATATFSLTVEPALRHRTKHARRASSQNRGGAR